MLINIFLAATCLLNVAAAIPAPIPQAGGVSNDGQCGTSNGLTCTGSGFGGCCSQYGWCGTSAAHCGTGCQPAYGTCSGSTTTSSTSSTTRTSSTATATSSTLSDCLTAKNVPISLISSPNFAQLAKPYNLRLAYNPAVIVLPTTVKHIQDAVTCAAQNGVKVQAKSGGHSYASFSSGGKNGSMVISLENFQNVSVDSATGIAQVDGGLRLGNMAQAIYNQGKRALAHGTCPGVGIGGHFTHGGYGYDSRKWGLAMDAIVSLDMVLANGTAIHATSTAYPDIYYACRGACDSFGIVTKFYLQTQAAPTTVINWQYSFPNMFASTSRTKFINTMLHIQAFARNATVVDRNIGFGIYMDGSGFTVSGTYIGTLSKFNTKIAPELLRTLPTPSSQSVKALDWISSLTALGGIGTLSEPTTGYDAHDNFFAKSITVPESSPLTNAALGNYFDYILAQGINPPSPWFSIINLYGGPDSQINTKDVNFAAYSDRDSLWVFQHYGFTSGSTLPSAELTFVNGLNTAITSKMPNVAFGAYLNYLDPSLSAADAHNVYYGASLYAKLLSIKQAADPKSVFWNPQAIGV